MNRIQLNGRLYALPFAGLIRPLTDVERSALRESILAHGVQDAVHTYVSPAHGRSVLDGAHRSAIATDLDADANVPVKDHGHIPDEAARELCLTLNADRRQLSPAEMTALRLELAEQRRVRVAAAKLAGDSNRLIAQREGIAPVQIDKDVERLVERGVLTDPHGGLVRGRDGRMHPAIRPRKADPVPPGKVMGRDGRLYPATKKKRESITMPPPLPRPPANPYTAVLIARSQLATLAESLDHVLAGPLADALAVFALAAGVPLLVEHGARTWPAIAGIDRALAHLAANAATPRASSVG